MPSDNTGLVALFATLVLIIVGLFAWSVFNDPSHGGFSVGN